MSGIFDIERSLRSHSKWNSYAIEEKAMLHKANDDILWSITKAVAKQSESQSGCHAYLTPINSIKERSRSSNQIMNSTTMQLAQRTEASEDKTVGTSSKVIIGSTHSPVKERWWIWHEHTHISLINTSVIGFAVMGLCILLIWNIL